MTENSALELRPPRMTVLSDHPSLADCDSPDLLHLESRLSAVFDILRHKKTRCPITAAVYGDWGTGKTSAMRWLETMLNRWNSLPKQKRDGHPRVHPVWFDPWRYHTRDEVWRGIIAEVILALFSLDILDRESFATRMREAAKLFGSFLGKSFLHALANVEVSFGQKDAGGVKLSGKVFRDIYDECDKALNPEKAYLNQFESTLRDWVQSFLSKENGKFSERIAIFIDDLDRSLPAVTLEVLEALKLYLNMEPLIFVVGLDRAIVDAVVYKHYQECGVGERKSREYLNKLFQIEIQVAPSERQMRGYFDHQFAGTTEISEGYWREMLQAEEHRTALEKGIRYLARHNPRELKRLLNSSLILGRAAVDNLLLAPQSGDTPDAQKLRFTQGVQFFLLQRLAQDRLSNTSRLLIEEQGLRWFEEASEFVQKHPTFRLPVDFSIDEYFEERPDSLRGRRELSKFPLLRSSDLNISEEGLDELERLTKTRPCDDLGNPLDLKFIFDEVLWMLLSIPFSAAVAQFSPLAGSRELTASTNLSSASEENNSIKSLVIDALHHLELVYEQKGIASGIETGFPDLDRISDGFHPGEIYVIGARPKAGTTSFALTIASHIATKSKKSIGIFSLELSPRFLVRRMLYASGKTNFQKARDGYLSENDFQNLVSAASALAESKIHINTAEVLTLNDFRVHARRMKKEKHVDVIFVDSFQGLILNDQVVNKQHPNDYSQPSKMLKSVAEELRIPLVVLSRLKADQGENRPPQLSDLLDAGPLEHYVDSVWFLHNFTADDFMERDCYPAPRLESVRLSIAKQRSGPIGDISLVFDQNTMRFESPAADPNTDEPIVARGNRRPKPKKTST